MIVRNESPVMRRCLKSVKSLIDYWVIVDTGSDDGTQEIISDEMQGIPGVLYERPWVDFSHNRTEALDLAKGKGDYVLLIDADEEVVMAEGFELPELTEQLYLVDVHLGLLSAYRELFINNHLDWYWVGVLHEQICCKTPLNSYGTIQGIRNVSHPDGCRSLDPQKFLKELEILKRGLEKEPKNSRYMFYLAQTQAACGHWKEARESYTKRAEMSGWDMEAYQSLYRIGLLEEMLQYPPFKVIESYQRANRFLPIRAEPIFRIAYQYYFLGNFREAKRIAAIGCTLKIPDARHAFYIEPFIYESWMAKLFADCCFDLGEENEALQGYLKIKDAPSLSKEAKDEIKIKIVELRDRLNQSSGLNTFRKSNFSKKIQF